MWQKNQTTNCQKHYLIACIQKNSRHEIDVRAMHQFQNSEKNWQKIRNFYFFFNVFRSSRNDTKHSKFVIFMLKTRRIIWKWQRIISFKCWNNVWFTFIKIAIDLTMLKQRLKSIADFVLMKNLSKLSINWNRIVFFMSMFRNIVHLLIVC